MRKKVSIIIAVTAAVPIFLISGCDTVAAVRSGDLKVRDVVQMNKMDSMSEARVQDIASAEETEGAERKEAAGPVGAVTGVFKKADNWFRDNLW